MSFFGRAFDEGIANRMLLKLGIVLPSFVVDPIVFSYNSITEESASFYFPILLSNFGISTKGAIFFGNIRMRFYFPSPAVNGSCFSYSVRNSDGSVLSFNDYYFTSGTTGWVDLYLEDVCFNNISISNLSLRMEQVEYELSGYLISRL
jgi:hypothetical protein